MVVDVKDPVLEHCGGDAQLPLFPGKDQACEKYLNPLVLSDKRKERTTILIQRGVERSTQKEVGRNVTEMSTSGGTSTPPDLRSALAFSFS